MNQNILISIVTPVFNGEKFLQENINSWLSQTYQNFEVIFVDDGSIDGSKDLINCVAKEDHRFKLVYQENSGISEATEKGIAVAKSEYIVLMDQDDVAMPKRLEHTVWAFRNGAELIMGDYEIVDESLQSTGKTIKFPTYFIQENLLLEHLKRMYFLGSSMAFRNKGDFNINSNSFGATDYEIVLKMLLNKYQFTYIPHTLIKYRVHKNNTSANYAKQKDNIKSVFKQFDHKDLYNKMINRGYSEYDVNLALGICYLFQNENGMASRYLIKANDINQHANERTLEEVLFYNGVLMYLEQKYVSSIDFFISLLNKKYNNPAIFNNIGVLNVILGDKYQAQFMFKRALEYNADYLDAKRNLSLSSKNNGDVVNYYFTSRLLRQILTHNNIII